MRDGQPGAWPCLGANSTGEEVPCCSLKGIHKQKDFGCKKAQLVLSNAEFRSVGTLLQLQGYNGDIIRIKSHSASYQKNLPPCFAHLSTVTDNLHLWCLFTSAAQNRYTADSSWPACPPLPLSPNPQGCRLAKVCFIRNVTYTKETDLISFENLLGYYYTYLLRLALIAQFQDVAGSKQGFSKFPGSKLRLWILNHLLIWPCSQSFYLVCNATAMLAGNLGISRKLMGPPGPFTPATPCGFTHRTNIWVHELFPLPLQSYNTKTADTARQHE